MLRRKGEKRRLWNVNWLRPRSLSGFGLEFLGLLLVAVALLSALALFSYNPKDASFQLTQVQNEAGAWGASVSSVLVNQVGLGGWVVALALLVCGGRLLFGISMPRLNSRFFVSGFLLLLSVSTFPELLSQFSIKGPGFFSSGVLGETLARFEMKLLSSTGALLINTVFLAFSSLGVAGVSPLQAAVAIGRVSRTFVDLSIRFGQIGFRRVRLVARWSYESASRIWSVVQVLKERRARRGRVSTVRQDVEPSKSVVSKEEIFLGSREKKEGPPSDPSIVDHREDRRKLEPAQEEFLFREKAQSGPYEFPDMDIFQTGTAKKREYDRESLIMNSRILEKKLQDYGVQGKVVTVHPGPVITMYEFEPASGIKVNRIVNLADDLALALRALTIRIIAPIPGKSVVGIEVPNPEREVVYIKDLLDSQNFKNSESYLPIALGKDIFGNPVEADLSRMPHLLVAGATGTGKSVFLNALLCSILCRSHPEDVKLLLVDPKLLELSIYEGIPHLIAEVVTNPKRAAAALSGVLKKMEDRYKMMAALGVRNVSQFNERVSKELEAGETHFRLRPEPGEDEGLEVPYGRLPYIVVVIDELADLMLIAAREVEASLQRLAQMARAAGIHLVLATQRPSVDVITGVIKANFPSRISFQVSSGHDSRTILDHKGAEQLLGQGDMLYLAPGTSRLQRLHGPFVTEEEVALLVKGLRSQGGPNFDQELLRLNEESEAREIRGDDLDELYDKALEIVAETRKASISYIQRNLRIGYNRAARIVEQMEQEGAIGPQVGSKDREVFVRPLGEGYE